ncbi:MAG: hypothetical protein JRD94_15015 [Deltaproteobacteria bacterium]|nr:hypothetical protein [Deltaproteobacteria bacterium]
MKSTLGSMIGFALCALMLSACGDALPGFGCPGGDKTFDFCIDSGNGNCYYVVDGQQLNCGNCFEGDTVNACAQEAAEACTNN